MKFFTGGRLPRAGKGLLSCLVILLGVELYLHNPDFLHRYRSVFAVGRAADKLEYANHNYPRITFLGNSRVDNSIAPRVIADILGVPERDVFNFGIPGVNSRVLAGIAKEIWSHGSPQPGQDTYFVLGLDDTLLTLEDNLNYSVFFADRGLLLRYKEWRTLSETLVRLWSYSGNLKGLREPARMRDFQQATLYDREPWGGALRENLGYRAQDGALNDRQRREGFTSSLAARPDPLAVEYLMHTVDRLKAKGAHLAVFNTPLYKGQNAFGDSKTDAYRQILEALEERGVSRIRIPAETKFAAEEFFDPGHLNRSGAERFSRLLADALLKQWPELRTRG